MKTFSIIAFHLTNESNRKNRIAMVKNRIASNRKVKESLQPYMLSHICRSIKRHFKHSVNLLVIRMHGHIFLHCIKCCITYNKAGLWIIIAILPSPNSHREKATHGFYNNHNWRLLLLYSHLSVWNSTIQSSVWQFQEELLIIYSRWVLF